MKTKSELITEEIVLVPIDQIVVTNRLRKTDPERIKDLAQSIEGIDLLHPISLAEKDGEYILLDGNHRIESFKLLGRSEVPAIVRKSNELINQLVEVESNRVFQ